MFFWIVSAKIPAAKVGTKKSIPMQCNGMLTFC